MAAVATIETKVQLGGTYELAFGAVAFDSSYPSGGEAVAATGIARIEWLIASPGPAAASGFGYGFYWDRPNQKLLVAYADYDAGADGPLIQIPDTTSLAALTAVPFIAVYEN